MLACDQRSPVRLRLQQRLGGSVPLMLSWELSVWTAHGCLSGPKAPETPERVSPHNSSGRRCRALLALERDEFDPRKQSP